MNPSAVITGGGSGIGAATAWRLAQDGYDVVVCGRRRERLEQVRDDLGGNARAVVLDVTDAASVAQAAARIGRCDVLINNAGGALGLDRVEDGRPHEWRAMYESNVLGVLHVTQAFLPLLRRSPAGGTIVVVSSTAGILVYEGGAGYSASKHAATALTETLRLELAGEPVRVVEIDPGMVYTEEFSLNRFRGDPASAESVYAGVDRPLTADDVAACIGFCVGLPQHVNVDRLVVKPVAQAALHKVHRGPLDWHHTTTAASPVHTAAPMPGAARLRRATKGTPKTPAMAPDRPEAGPALVVLGGLPGAGKTTLARAVVRRLRAVLVRVDTVEQALRDAGLPEDLGPLGYAAAFAFARDQLEAGYVVVADSVNPVEVTRSGWREAATRAGARLLQVEVICSDPAEHRRRAEGRQSDIPGLRLPTWAQVTEREYHPWAADLSVDTSAGAAEVAAVRVEAALAGRPVIVG